MITTITIVLITVLLTLTAYLYTAYTKRQQELNTAFEDKIRAIYNKELNAYFMSNNISDANNYNQSVNSCRCGYNGDDDSVCSNCGKSIYRK